MSVEPDGHKRSSFGHKPSLVVYGLILMLILLNVATIVLFSISLHDLRQEHTQSLNDLAQARAELDRYKAAYQGVVEDAQAFGKIYDLNYKDRGSNVSDPTSPAADRVFSSDEVKRLPKVNVAEYYLAQGMFNDSCISTTKLVNTPQDIVEIVIIAHGDQDKEWPKLGLMVDGSLLNVFTLNDKEDAIYKTVVDLPKGRHYLDLVYYNAEESDGMTISLVRIGDRTVEAETGILDYGEGFRLFDCNDVDSGNSLDESGAMRFRIEKV